MAVGGRHDKIKGLVVVLTIEQTYIGERVAVHEAVEKSYQESKSEVRQKGDLMKGHEVLVQGGVIDDLAKHLVQQYGIPKKYIEVIDKTKR
ncbi:hypothetical protein AgCh_017260 [Apium graveolens]